MDYDLKKLEVHFKDVEKLLSDNLGKTYARYMASEIPNGRYQHVLGRHTNATILANLEKISKDADIKLVSPEELFKAGAPLFMDLENAVDHLTGDAKIEAQEKVSALQAFYEESGFTAKHPFFEFPVQPKKAEELVA